MALAAWLSRMAMATAGRGPLLGYVPTCYLDAVLDVMSSVRHAQEATSGSALPPAGTAPPVGQLLAWGLPDVIALLSHLLYDPRICNPDVKEALVGCVSAMLEQRELLAAFEASGPARQHLVPAAVACFDSRLWHPVSQVRASADQQL